MSIIISIICSDNWPSLCSLKVHRFRMVSHCCSKCRLITAATDNDMKVVFVFVILPRRWTLGTVEEIFFMGGYGFGPQYITWFLFIDPRSYATSYEIVWSIQRNPVIFDLIYRIREDSHIGRERYYKVYAFIDVFLSGQFFQIHISTKITSIKDAYCSFWNS